MLGDGDLALSAPQLPALLLLHAAEVGVRIAALEALALQLRRFVPQEIATWALVRRAHAFLFTTRIEIRSVARRVNTPYV